jgi:hypothetical protein
MDLAIVARTSELCVRLAGRSGGGTEKEILMPIENRNLAVGTRLTANYKKQSYVCTVEAAESGEGLVYALQGGKRHKSPSSAGMEVMGGKAVNGWRFWSVETEGTEAPPAKPEKRRGGKGKTASLFKKLPPNGLEEGQQRFFCTACQKSFITTEERPEACPEGHRENDPELTAPPSADAVAADQAEVAE